MTPLCALGALLFEQSNDTGRHSAATRRTS
jgi:hypothetical protein